MSILGNMAIIQGQQGRLFFAFLFEEEDEEKAQEGRRRDSLLRVPLLVSISSTSRSSSAAPSIESGRANSSIRQANVRILAESTPLAIKLHGICH
jgi:hypothetical protein